MKIVFVPIRSDAALELARDGEALSFNGERYDFAPLSEGATLPREAVDCRWLAGPVERRGGRLHLSVLLPHGAGAPRALRFPAPLLDPPDGPIAPSAAAAAPAGETDDAAH